MPPTDPGALPATYAVLETSPPDGWALMPAVLDPVLVVRRDGDHYVTTLEARRMRRGVEIRLTAAGLDRDWVHDGRTIHPLPRDVGQIVGQRLKGLDPSNLSFPDALALQRRGDEALQVQLDDAVLAPANAVAADEPDPEAVPGLQANLFPYQARGIAWMDQTLRRTGGLVLADEMGLGKTIQIIGAMLLTPPQPDSPALVLCPTTLIANWVRELEKFAPSLTVMVHRGPDRVRLHNGLRAAQVVITTYDTAVNDLVLFKAVEWSWLVCDEAQAIKNPASRRRISVGQLSRQRSIPVTGTPVENTLLDLWSLVDVAIPGLLGSQSWFEGQFPDNQASAETLARLTNPIVLKRQVRDVAQDLPPRMDVQVPVELGAGLAGRYNEVLEQTFARFPTAGALVATGQLQLFCAHPWLQSSDVVSPDWEERVRVARGSGTALMTPKLERTVELLAEAFANGRKVLVFANFNACGPILLEAAAALPQAFWGAINGSTPPEDRQALVDAFSAHAGPAVLVLNPRAAGAGLNITAATVVIHYTQVWNPALELQASARAHRRGQTLPVTVYHMFYVDTVEEVMMDRAQRRRELGAEAVPTNNQDREDLARALSLVPGAR